MLIDYNSLMPFFGKSSTPSIPTSVVINFGIISLLQLAYWYSKCSVSSTFGLKEIELRALPTTIICVVSNVLFIPCSNCDYKRR
jgi:hypothetical protein